MRRVWILLLVIFALGAFLRFYQLDQAGMFNVDESRTLLDARAKHEEIRIIGEIFHHKWQEMHGGPEFLLSEFLPKAHARLEEHHPVFPKYLFAYAIACAMFIGGITPWIGHLVEAIFGTLTIGVVFFFVKDLYSRREALLAAALLAVSCFHVYFSRNTYSESLAVFLWLLAFHAHFRWGRTLWKDEVQPSRKALPLLLCGVFAGLAFLATFQITAALPALTVLHALVCMGEHGWRKRARAFVWGGVLMTCGFLATVFALELVNYPMLLLYRSEGLLYPHTTPFEAFIRRWAYHSSRGIHPSGLLVFPYFLGVFEGWTAFWTLLVLLVTGTLRIGANLRSERDPARRCQTILPLLYLGPAIAVPFVIFSVKTIVGARIFSCVLPFLTILVAAGAVAIWQSDQSRHKWRRVLVCAALVLVTASSLLQDAKIMRIRSAYPEVLAWLHAQGETTAVSPWQGPLSWYLTCNGMEPPEKATAKYCVTDWQSLYYNLYPDTSVFLNEGATPVITFEHQFGRLFLEGEAIPHEPTHPLKDLLRVRTLDLERYRKVHVYRIEDTQFNGVPAPSAATIHE